MTLTTLRLSRSGKTVTLRDQGTGVPILLIHGVGLQSAAWGPQIDALCKSHRVIAVDLPGHGGSDPLKPDSQLPDYVDWCHDVVQALAVGPVNLAGHSMGALIAGGFAVAYPAMTTRVCLINGVFCRSEAARGAVRGRAAEISAGNVDLEAPLARWFKASKADAVVRKQVAGWLRAVDLDGYATAYGAFASGDATYAKQYGDIACPFMALTGGDDPNSTPAMSSAMVANARNAKAVTIDGHRHMVTLTAPDIVNSHLEAWLRMPSSVKELQ